MIALSTLAISFAVQIVMLGFLVYCYILFLPKRDKNDELDNRIYKLLLTFIVFTVITIILTLTAIALYL